ncbi:MAG: hypothetical protein ACE5HS_05710 [bacterium]
MAETFKIIKKNGKKHLIEIGFLGDIDHGELHESLFGGTLYTSTFFGTSFKLTDRSGLFSSGNEYKVRKSNGEEGVMKKSWSGDTYHYHKNKESKRKSKKTANSKPQSPPESSDLAAQKALSMVLIVLGIIGMF